VEDEEVDEREQRGADDERRHGRRQPAAAALARRRRRQQRRGRMLVPLHAVAVAVLVCATCSALLHCSSPERCRQPVSGGGGGSGGEVVMELLPALSCKKQAKRPRASRV
jgi:hypothetical protein